MDRRLFSVALSGMLFGLLCEAAGATESYVCEIVEGNSRVDMIDAAENTRVTIGKSYRLVTSSTSDDSVIDLAVYEDATPQLDHFEPVLKYQAQVKKGPGAPRITWVLPTATIECATQRLESLSWSPRAMAVLMKPQLVAKAHKTGEKIVDEVRLKEAAAGGDLLDVKLFVPSGAPEKFVSPF